MLYNLPMNTLEQILSSISKFYSLCLEHNATLVLATKTIPVETLRDVCAASSIPLVFGENKVQELKDKYFEANNLSWHFIGRLQTNKVKYLIGKVSMIQSVDSLRLLEEISARSKKKGVTTDILMEVNFGEEESKGGVKAQEALSFATQCMQTENVRLRGIMSVLPVSGDLPALMEQAKELSNTLVATYGKERNILSVGMSEDYAMALENGSNMIRIGSAIFGTRSYQV